MTSERQPEQGGRTRDTRPRTAMSARLGLGCVPSVAALALALMLAASAALSLPVAARPAPSPEAAIEAVVEADGRQYAGLCERTRSPDDIGKVCSKLIDQHSGVQAYLIGRVFSEFSTWVFVAPRDGGWTVAATAPLDFHDVSGAVPWPR